MKTDKRKISLCITNFNRYEMLLKSFLYIIKDHRVSEIIISDDCSDWEIYDKLDVYFRGIDVIKMYRNDKNIGMSRNKARSVELASNDWCIVFDSDNMINTNYLDRIYEHQWDEDIIYCPEFAKPNFDYRKFAGHRILKQNVKSYLDKPLFDCLLNTCNYFVNKKRYLETYRYNPEMKASDTVWFNYLHLISGGSLFVVPGLQYQHLVHDGSDFAKEMNYNLNMAQKVRTLIAAL